MIRFLCLGIAGEWAVFKDVVLLHGYFDCMHICVPCTGCLQRQVEAVWRQNLELLHICLPIVSVDAACFLLLPVTFLFSFICFSHVDVKILMLFYLCLAIFSTISQRTLGMHGSCMPPQWSYLLSARKEHCLPIALDYLLLTVAAVSARTRWSTFSLCCAITLLTEFMWRTMQWN